MLGPNIRRACSTLLRPAVVAALTAVLLIGPELSAAPKKPSEFSEGIKAQDRSFWEQSAQLMSQAAKLQPDDGLLTRIYGTRFEPYLPLYFLGLASYKQGKCREANEHWNKCIQEGAVQHTDKYKLLQQYQKDCPPH